MAEVFAAERPGRHFRLLPHRSTMVAFVVARCASHHQDGISHEQTHFRDRRRGQLARQGAYQRLDRHVAGTTRTAGPHAKTRPVSQRRSGHDEPLPARRGLCAGRRQRDRPRPGPLRTVHQQPAEPPLELHHRPDLPVGDPEGAAGRVLGPDRAGHPPHHQRDQGGLEQAGRPGGRRRHHRDRRHGGRHREPAVPGGHPPVLARRGQGELPLHPPDVGPLPEGGCRAEDQAHATFRGPVAADRHPARHSRLPHRAVASRATTGPKSPCSATCRSRR